MGELHFTTDVITIQDNFMLLVNMINVQSRTLCKNMKYKTNQKNSKNLKEGLRFGSRIDNDNIHQKYMDVFNKYYIYYCTIIEMIMKKNRYLQTI